MRLVHMATVLLCLVAYAGAQEIVNDEGTMIEMTGAASDLRPILPPVIYAIPGVEVNVYFDNIILSPHSDRLLWDVDCALGAHQQERWTAVPTGEQVGEHPLTVRVVSPEMQTLLQMETTLHVLDPEAGAGREITVLCIGASGTAASHYTARLVELFVTDPAVEARLIGEAGPEDDPRNRHEGYGGWSCRTFVENWADGQDYLEIDGRVRRGRSPFLFEIDGEPRLDFQRYLDANNGGQPPDFITILLGGNDNFTATEADVEARIDTMFGYLDRLIAAICVAAPHAQIGVVPMTPPAASQDAFAASYGTAQTRWQYRRTQHRTTEREYERYGGREAEGISLVPAFVALDTVYGYPTASAPANVHAQVEIARMSNGLHPSPGGYYQIGDAFYCWIKSRLALQ